MINLSTVLKSVGLKVKFQASLIWFQPVCGLCACGQQFLSGGGLFPLKAT